MSVDNFEDSQEVLMEGISQILGKSPLPKGVVATPPCVHESDGFVYGDTPVYVLLTCTKCGEQYEQSKV